MKRTNLIFIIGLLLVLVIVIAGCTEKDTLGRSTTDGKTTQLNSVGDIDKILNEQEKQMLNNQKNQAGSYAHVKAAASVFQIVNHPAFNGFGQYILPVENRAYNENMRLDNINSLLPYHNHIDPDTTVKVINYMLDQANNGKTVFYDFYTEQQKQQDAAKKSTGLFFFRGKPGAPFAIVCAGGGFSYVGSIHESFPHALELSKKGYNTFALKYRVGGESMATEDLAAALSYIFKNAKTFGVSTKDYSLWGGSAGARMAANIAANGTARYGGGSLPGPCIIVMAYTGHASFSANDPPTFVTVSEDDRIVNVSVVERRIKNMRTAGIEVEYRKYKNAGHGFGLGIGTDAAGWIEEAIAFWAKHLSEKG